MPAFGADGALRFFPHPSFHWVAVERIAPVAIDCSALERIIKVASTGANVWRAGLKETAERGAHLGGCSRLGRARMGPTKSAKPEQAEQEEGHEQEEQHMVGHQDSRYLKMGEWKDNQSQEALTSQ